MTTRKPPAQDDPHRNPQTNIRLTPDDRTSLDELAGYWGVSRSEMVAMLVRGARKGFKTGSGGRLIPKV